MTAFTTSELVQKQVSTILNEDVYTALPAKIITVKNLNKEQVVDVQPLLQKVYEDGLVVKRSPLLDVPVVFPSGGGGALTFPLKVGDIVLVVFSMESLEEFIITETPTETIPTDRRKFSFSDGVAIPCLPTFNNNQSPNTTDVELKFAGSSVKLKPDGDVTVDVAKDLTAMVQGNGLISAAGDLEANCMGDGRFSAGGKLTLHAVGDIDITAGGNVNITGSTINLN